MKQMYKGNRNKTWPAQFGKEKSCFAIAQVGGGGRGAELAHAITKKMNENIIKASENK